MIWLAPEAWGPNSPIARLGAPARLTRPPQVDRTTRAVSSTPLDPTNDPALTPGSVMPDTKTVAVPRIQATALLGGLVILALDPGWLVITWWALYYALPCIVDMLRDQP